MPDSEGHDGADKARAEDAVEEVAEEPPAAPVGAGGDLAANGAHVGAEAVRNSGGGKGGVRGDAASPHDLSETMRTGRLQVFGGRAREPGGDVGARGRAPGAARLRRGRGVHRDACGGLRNAGGTRAGRREPCSDVERAPPAGRYRQGLRGAGRAVFACAHKSCEGPAGHERHGKPCGARCLAARRVGRARLPFRRSAEPGADVAGRRVGGAPARVRRRAAARGRLGQGASRPPQPRQGGRDRAVDVVQCEIAAGAFGRRRDE
mmetsp:Transcript_30560/g.83986  ORF Transcript_30560/g.83986 Transcript_30560/m.83986 type:complete len:263 (+) Transcript_30560:548-1336(+)